MKKIQRFSMFVVLCGMLYDAAAQASYKFTAATDTVTADGFYKINLVPAIVAKCRPVLEDLRLLDAGGKQVPYIISDGETFNKLQFKPFKKIAERTDAGGVHTVEIENVSAEATNNLVLIFKNAIADRSVNISGSNDAIHWYIIREFINLENISSSTDGDYNFMQQIAFPTVAYKYFKVYFIGKQHDPLFIERIGIYKSTDAVRSYFAVPNPLIIQKDSSDGNTYIRLVSAANYRLHKQQIFASGSKFYNRNLLFYTGYYNSAKAVEPATLSSASDNIFFVNYARANLKTDTINFRIQNDDNPPLHIDSVKFYQQAYTLYAYLKAGQPYRLAFGNDSLVPPVYDLPAFADSIHTATLLPTYSIVMNNTPAANSTTKPAFSKTWLWLTMAVVLVLLLLFTASLLRQVHKKEADQQPQ